MGFHHVEGFLDCSMFKENKLGLEVVTLVEKPCMMLGDGIGEPWSLVTGLHMLPNVR